MRNGTVSKGLPAKYQILINFKGKARQMRPSPVRDGRKLVPSQGGQLGRHTPHHVCGGPADVYTKPDKPKLGLS